MGVLDVPAASIVFEPIGRLIGDPVSCSGFCLETAHLDLLAVRKRNSHIPATFGLELDRLKFCCGLGTRHVLIMRKGGLRR